MKKWKQPMIHHNLERILLVFTVIVCVLLSVIAASAGILAMGWTVRMQDHSFVMPDESLEGHRFDIGGKTYECLPLPEGVDAQMLKDRIDPAAYDEVVRGDIDYLMFKDPMETGENVILFLPIYRLGQDKEPLVLYVVEVTEG